MNFIYSVAIFVFLLNMNILAQEDTVFQVRNQIYAEAFGLGGYGSVNFERILFFKGHHRALVKGGIGTYRIIDFNNNFNPDLIFPFGLTYLFGSIHYIEFGLGETLSSIVEVSHHSWQAQRYIDFHSTALIGYRYQKNIVGIVVRCFYSPILESNQYYRHWGGLSVGYSF